MASQIPYLDVQNLTKRFGAQVLFDNISFSIAEGQKVGLVARNGTGKSTLMSVLMDKEDRKSTRLNSSHVSISYAVFCLKKKNKKIR